MSRRPPNPNVVKINRSYEVHELAMALGVHRNTVRGWMKKGLQAIDVHRPYLFRGEVVRAFLKAQRQSPYSKCLPHELFCLKCKAPKHPMKGQVEYIPLTPTSGNLRGQCEACGRPIYKRASLAKLEEISGLLTIRHSQAKNNIGDIPQPCDNCDLKAPGDTHD